MLSFYLLRYLIPPLLLFNAATATEKQCHDDCRAVPSRLVGPTRPSDEMDSLGNPVLRQTRSHPYHAASTEDYDFPRFCELGCTFFFTSSGAGIPRSLLPRDKSNLDICMEQCDDTYRYNVTVGYSDVLEMARLECRDGCQIGLLRCQPGYYCKQALPGKVKSQGGDMLPCPAGTFRGVSYDQVTECVPCPPNTFREDVKGKSLSSCSKCPADTSSRQQSTSIQDCLRCPAGTMSTEGTSCRCITPQACDANQPPFPADAEKKDSVPYIGRW